MPAPEGPGPGAAPVLVARQLRAARLPARIGAHPGLDLALEPGSVSCVIGPQDTGKTQWLRTLAGIEPPAGGQLLIEGKDCSALDEDAWRRLRARVGYVSDTTPLLSVLNGLSNVMLAAQYHRLADPAELRRRAFVWLERLGWHGPVNRLPAHLTRHQRCLLMLARCLMLDPAVLFINEPFSLTDVGGWRHLASVFLKLAREFGIALVLLTHDLPFVRKHAWHILFTSTNGIRAYSSWRNFVAEGDRTADDFRATADIAFSGI